MVSRKTKLQNCETMSTYFVLDVNKNTTWIDVRKGVMQESTLADVHETNHGTVCGMYAMYLKQLSSYGSSWEGSLETLTQSANQLDGVTVSTTVVFVTDSGGEEDKLKHHDGTSFADQMVQSMRLNVFGTVACVLTKETS